MPEITTVEKDGHIGHIVKVKPGPKVMLCRFYESATFPLCELVHAKYEATFGPLIIQGVKEEEG